MYIGIQLRLSSLCLFTIFELLSSIGKERRTFYSQVAKSPLIVPVIQQTDSLLKWTTITVAFCAEQEQFKSKLLSLELTIK